jgi:TRAP-type mannitol/chloroaromatic compound transport system, periplasmic component
MVQAASHEAHVVTQARYDARNPGALKQLVASKAKVLAFPQTVLDASYKTTMAVYAELAEKNPAWKKIYGDYRNFQRDEVLWFRFAEARYDAFMSAQKL